MDDRHELDYAPRRSRSGYSLFGIASIGMAILVFLFVIVCGTEFLDMSPFQSMGNEKELRVSCIAAVLGILLAVRDLSDPVSKGTLGVIGLIVNVMGLIAAWICLPFL
jgi:hypothetical protein